MAPIESSIEIARPPEEVFAYLVDPTRFAEWQRDVVRRAAGRPPPGPAGRTGELPQAQATARARRLITV